MKFMTNIKAVPFVVGAAILVFVAVYAYAEFGESLRDRRLPQRYEQIQIGMPQSEVYSILGAPNFITVANKVGANGGSVSWSDQRYSLIAGFDSNSRLSFKRLYDFETELEIAHEP